MIDQKRLLTEIRHRLPFRVAQRLLKANGFPKGRSWKEIFDKLEDKGGQQGVKTTELFDAYKEVLLSCDKVLTVYEVDENELKGLHAHADKISKNLGTHQFVEAFPYTLSETNLSKLPQNEATAVAVLEVKNATAIIYCTSRLVEIREELLPQFLNKDIDNPYDKVFGYKRLYMQAFNAIVIPYNGINIEVYTDLIDKAPFSTAQLDQLTLRNEFNKTFGKIILKNPVNFFPAIRPLYESDEGDVSLLSHAVANGVKTERMRGSKSVRQELFHQGGAAAVAGNLTPYQIAIHWDANDGTEIMGRPTLRLEGDYQMTYQARPTLTDATIGKCATYAEAKDVVTKLMSFIPKEALDEAA